MRVATIDIGTNSVLLLIAERRSSGELVAVEEHATITRLGEHVDRTRELAPAAIARTNACIDAYAGIVRSRGVTRVAVVGTSAMRDARGGEAVRGHVRDALGVDARVISGDEEARLTFAGALSGLGYPATAGSVVVFDIGGGSTEIVEGHLGASSSIGFAKSFDIGSVRLTERHVHADPPSDAELAALEADARATFASAGSLPSALEPVGIAGTVTTLAAVALRLPAYDGARVHGYAMRRQDVALVVDELARLPLQARRSLPGMEPKRADVIVAGGVLVLAVLDALGAPALRVSDRGVRWGLAEQIANAP